MHTKECWNRCGLVYLLWQHRSLICDRGVEAEERMGEEGRRSRGGGRRGGGGVRGGGGGGGGEEEEGKEEGEEDQE